MVSGGDPTREAVALGDPLLDPFAVSRLLRGADLERIAQVFEQARARGQRAWMTMAVCVGEAQEAAGRGDAVIERMASLFGLHRSRIARLGRIYREALRPRLAAGPPASFPLAEQAWYEIATEAAGPLGRDVLDLLGEAEERKRTDPRYSTRRWKADLGIAPSSAASGQLGALLVRLAGIEDDAVEEFARGDVDRNRDLLEAAALVIDRAARGTAGSPSRSPAPRDRADASPHSPRPASLASCGGERWLFDRQGRTAWVHPGLAAAFGEEPEALASAPFWLFHARSEEARLAWERIVRSGDPPPDARSLVLGGPFRGRGAGGGAAPAVEAHLLLDASGTVCGLELAPPLAAPELGPNASAPPRPDSLPPPSASGSPPAGRTPPIWVVDADGRSVFTSPQIAAALGAPQETVERGRLEDFSLDPVRTRTFFELAKRDAEPSPEEIAPPDGTRLRAPGGRVVTLPLEAIFHRTPAGEFLGLTLVASRPLAERRPTARPARDSLWVIRSTDLETVFVSPELARLLGTTDHQMAGRSAVPYLTRAPDTPQTSDRLRRQHPFWLGRATAAEFLRADGAPIVLAFEASAMRDAYGRLTHVAASFAAGTSPDPRRASSRSAGRSGPTSGPVSDRRPPGPEGEPSE